MDPATALTAALLSLLPPAVRSDRAQYVGDLSLGIVRASAEATCTGPWSASPDCHPIWGGNPRELEALAGTLAFFESGLNPRIQAGDCRPEECDGRLVVAGKVVSRAATAFQIQGLSLSARWESVGLGEMGLYEASRHAVRILSYFRKNCGSGEWWQSCVVDGYAGRTRYFGTPRRVSVYQRVLVKIRDDRGVEVAAR